MQEFIYDISGVKIKYKNSKRGDLNTITIYQQIIKILLHSLGMQDGKKMSKEERHGLKL